MANNKKNVNNLGFDSKAVVGCHGPEIMTKLKGMPIYQGSTFKFCDSKQAADVFSGKCDSPAYSRLNGKNPNADQLARDVAYMEGAEDGITLATGMAAISTVLFSLAKPGDSFISTSTLYGCTYTLFKERAEKQFSMKPVFLTTKECSNKKFVQALVEKNKNAKFFYVETPANPTLDIVDIKMIADITRKYNIPVVVDNTFASPYLQKPLSLGAQVSLHSGTKYLNGHSTTVIGIITGSKAFINKARAWNNDVGGTADAMQSWLTYKGKQTLAVRMERHCKNANIVARHLSRHPKIDKVYYPGLTSHPGHRIAKKQMKDFGGMVSFEIKGGINAGKKFVNNLKLIINAVSLGSVNSLITHPASTVHAKYSSEERKEAGISDGLIRLSVGIEDVKDIISDIDNALRKPR